jgi:hypothetical protein
VKPDDERAIRQRLHAEFDSLDISPPPVIAVTQRGKAIRGRRRAVAGGFAAIAVVAVLAGRFLAQGPAPATVTVNAPRPGAPGGVFASGTADGRPWRMAVRNIAADPGTRWCLPAVMVNGHSGDVLFHTPSGSPSFGNPAFLDDIPGFPGVGAVFTQVAPRDTELVATLPSGRHLAVRPIWVSACGQRFHLAGFTYANPLRGISQLSTSTLSGPDESLVITQAHSAHGGNTGAGIWANLDKAAADIAASWASEPIGTGTVAGMTWHIKTGLGLFGQCYKTELWGFRHGRYGRGESSECVPVAAPPHTIALSWVSVPGATANLTGYAGLVNPRTRSVLVSISDGTTRTVRPVNVAGRAYVAFVVPPGCQVIRLRLTQAGGAVYATTSALPPAR